MSIERRRNKAKRSVRTLMCPRDLLVLPTTARDRPSPYDKGEGYRSAGACPPLFFVCLKQDFQDEQDFQDGAAQERGEKVWKPLMSIDTQPQQGEKVRRTLICPRALLAFPTTARDRPSPYGKRAVFRASRPREKRCRHPRAPTHETPHHRHAKFTED